MLYIAVDLTIHIVQDPYDLFIVTLVDGIDFPCYMNSNGDLLLVVLKDYFCCLIAVLEGACWLFSLNTRAFSN